MLSRLQRAQALRVRAAEVPSEKAGYWFREIEVPQPASDAEALAWQAGPVDAGAAAGTRADARDNPMQSGGMAAATGAVREDAAWWGNDPMQSGGVAGGACGDADSAAAVAAAALAETRRWAAAQAGVSNRK